MISLTLPMPPSANAYWRSICINGQPRVLTSKAARLYKKDVTSSVVAQVNGFPEMLEGDLHFDAVYYLNRGDGHNRDKVLMDALEGLAYENDRQIVKWTGRKVKVKRAEQRVRVVIQGVEG